MNKPVRYRLPIPGYYLIVAQESEPSGVYRGWQEIGHTWLDPLKGEGRDLVIAYCQADRRQLEQGVLEWPE